MALSASTIFLALIALVYFLVRQAESRPLKARAMLILPLVLAYAGIGSLDHLSSLAAAGFLTLNVAVAVALGAARGMSVRVWQSAGQVWQKGTSLTLGLWAASIGMRILLTGVGYLGGLAPNDLAAQLPLLLGITLAAQNLVVGARAITPRPLFA